MSKIKTPNVQTRPRLAAFNKGRGRRVQGGHGGAGRHEGAGKLGRRLAAAPAGTTREAAEATASRQTRRRMVVLIRQPAFLPKKTSEELPGHVPHACGLNVYEFLLFLR